MLEPCALSAFCIAPGVIDEAVYCCNSNSNDSRRGRVAFVTQLVLVVGFAAKIVRLGGAQNQSLGI